MLRELRACVEREAERRGVGWNQDIRHDRALDEFGFSLGNAGIDVAADVGIGPAVETAIFNRSGILWRQIVAEVVAFVDTRPQRVRARLPCQSNRIAEARSVDPQSGSIGIVLVDHGAAFIAGAGVVDIIGRPHRDIHLLTIAAEEDVTREVVAAPVEVSQLFSGTRSLRVAWRVFVPHNAVGVPHVEVTVMKCQPEGLQHFGGVRIRSSAASATTSGATTWSAATSSG